MPAISRCVRYQGVQRATRFGMSTLRWRASDNLVKQMSVVLILSADTQQLHSLGRSGLLLYPAAVYQHNPFINHSSTHTQPPCKPTPRQSPYSRKRHEKRPDTTVLPSRGSLYRPRGNKESWAWCCQYRPEFGCGGCNDRVLRTSVLPSHWRKTAHKHPGTPSVNARK